MVACGPALVGSGIPKWFNHKSRNSFGRIEMHTDLGSEEWKGYALFIVYQVREPHSEYGNSNSTTFDGGNHNFPYFFCEFHVPINCSIKKRNREVKEHGNSESKPIEVHLGNLVLCAREVPSVGTNGFWVYIPAAWFWSRGNSLGGWSYLKASITAGSLNVEVKKCGARVVRQHDASEFYQVLNSISANGLNLESCENLFLSLDSGRLGLKVPW
jgi:hypothetical protein